MKPENQLFLMIVGVMLIIALLIAPSIARLNDRITSIENKLGK